MLPSATEIVCALGMEHKLVGVSHSCSHPSTIRDLPRMTRTSVPFQSDSLTIDTYVREHLQGHQALYDLNLEALEAVQPDVIVSQALCDVCAVATGEVDEAIRALPCEPVLIDLTPNTLDDVFGDIEAVATELKVRKSGVALVEALKARVDAVAKRTAGIPVADRPSVAFLEWLIPPFNGGHWNPELVRLAGGLDLLGSPGEPSSTLDWPTIAKASPDVVFIACCGLTIERAMEDIGDLGGHPLWTSLSAVQNGRAYIADGDAYFASPGPRLIDGLEIMAHALHPDVHPRPAFYECRELSRQSA